MLRKSFQKQYFIIDRERTDKPRRQPAEEMPDCCVRCPGCKATLLDEDLKKTDNVCPRCGQHMRLATEARLASVFDDDRYETLFEDIRSENPLGFSGYEEKIAANQEKSGLPEAVRIARGRIGGRAALVGVMDARFMMGSMGSVVGEKVTRAAEEALRTRTPLIVFTASGGARMQEGIVSLMQMAKTSAAAGRLKEHGVPFFTVLTDPTTGGVTASFAMLGDVILAEPGALIGFAGPRVIEQTIRQTLPEGFQSAEFLLDKGFVDRIVPRDRMKQTLSTLLRLHGGEAK